MLSRDSSDPIAFADPSASEDKGPDEEVAEALLEAEPMTIARALGPRQGKSPHSRECRAFLSRVYRLALVRMESLCEALTLPGDVRYLVWSMLEQSLTGMSRPPRRPLDPKPMA